MPLKSTDQDDVPRDPSMLNSPNVDPENSPEIAPTDDPQSSLEPETEPVSKAPSGPAPNTTTPSAQMNPKFKDLKETGRWGAISKNEIIAVCIFALLAVAGAAVGIWFALTRDENGVEPTRPTQSPTAAPTNIGHQSELFYAFQAINYSDLTYEYQNDLPLNVADYEGLMDDPTATPQERAMSWLLFEDERDISTEVGQRWALASLYFTWQGENWVSAANWLSSNNICEWEHITCDLQSGLIGEIDLQSNNLVGTIPPEIVMLNTTKALWLRDNQLTGPLPNEVFGAMPQLTILYLDNNQLTGTISLSIRDNLVLNSLFLQSNNLTGEWPRLFCRFSSSSPAPISRFGIDCDKVTCEQSGCCDGYNCYYDEVSEGST